MTIKQAKNKIPIVAGQIFGRFKVKGEAPAKTFPSGNTQRMVYVTCSCGEERITGLAGLRNGHSKSCGCYNRERIAERFTTHGGCKDRLYSCWRDMIKRSKFRNCEIYSRWRKYEGFREWALSSGYDEHLVLCRNGDTGNYTPTNARWDTKGNNTREALGICCEVTHPDGTIEIISSIRGFCVKNGLDSPTASRVSIGKFKQHKGYKFRRVDGESYEISNKDG